jgi:hypothetical protein
VDRGVEQVSGGMGGLDRGSRRVDGAFRATRCGSRWGIESTGACFTNTGGGHP